MAVCKGNDCLGWTLGEGDIFCSWCGARLLELSVTMQQKRGGRWEPLTPPILNVDQKPELQVLVRNIGQTGPVAVRPSWFVCAATWLAFDLEPLKTAALKPNDTVALSVSRFKAPDQDSRHEAIIGIAQPGNPDPLGQVTLEVVPRPRFEVDMPVQRVQLEPGANVLDIGVVLRRGRATVNALPTLEGGWGTLEWGEGVKLPIEMDQGGNTRLPLRLRLRNETSETFAATKNDVILRRGSVMVRCVGREEVPIDVPVELEVTLAPLLYVEPFRDRRRMDWPLVRGLTDKKPLVLTLYNGYPGARGHADLEIRRIDIEGAAAWLKGTDLSSPLRLASGQSTTLPLSIDVQALPESGGTAQIVFSSNAKTSPYFVKVELREPGAFNGWLVIDLGTTNSCAALLDEDRAIEMVPLDLHPLEKPTTMPSVIGYQRMVAALDYEVGGRVWSLSHLPEVAASVVVAAKRRIGTGKPFTIVPQKEPGETCTVPAQDVLSHIYATIVQRATEMLAGRGDTQAIINRLIVAHPSRFTMRQIDELKAAVTAAVEPMVRRHLGAEARILDLRTIHEPLGAALHFLNDWRQQALMHARQASDDIRYTLLVYDFGGGTIDITLLEVHSSRVLRPGMSVPRPKNGNVDLATAVDQEALMLPALMGATLERCQQAVRSEGLLLQVAGVNGADDGDLAKNNAFLLEQFARSVLRVLPAQALVAGDEQAWNPLRHSAHVNERLALTGVGSGRRQRREFNRQDILPSVVEVRSRLLHTESGPAPDETAESHAFSYTVTPHVIGATGHRWLGGEDVTAMVRDLLVERVLRALRAQEKTEAVELPLDADTCPIQYAQAARNNTSLVRKWAEETKVGLSRSAPAEDLITRVPTLEVVVDGMLKPVAGTVLAGLKVFPSLDDLNRRLEPTLAITIDMAARLCTDCGGPDVVLRVGKSSQLPLVGRLLARAFPNALPSVPPDAKECVVQGACLQPLPGAGVTLSRGVARAGVRLGMGSAERLSATTSRLGIKVLDGGRAWFHEVLPAGQPIPEAGLFRRMEGFGLMTGRNRIPLLENAGTRDELLLGNGQRNPNVETLGLFEVDVPSDIDSELLANVDLSLGITPDLAVQLSVHVGDRCLGPYLMQAVKGE
ncbi:MAG TPA: hypothetical protein VGO93_03780 [Candidatus Xenobia bacterium]|jgi:hypothetical protein